MLPSPVTTSITTPTANACQYCLNQDGMDTGAKSSLFPLSQAWPTLTPALQNPNSSADVNSSLAVTSIVTAAGDNAVTILITAIPMVEEFTALQSELQNKLAFPTHLDEALKAAHSGRQRS